MKKLKFKQLNSHHWEYASDIQRIVKVFADRGYEISESDATFAWEAYSESMCAGWMYLDQEDLYVFQNAITYLEEVE